MYYCGNQTSIAILLLYCIISSFLPLYRRGGELLLLGGKSNQKRLRALVATIPASVFYGAELPPVLVWFRILQCAARKFHFFVCIPRVLWFGFAYGLCANCLQAHACRVLGAAARRRGQFRRALLLPIDNSAQIVFGTVVLRAAGMRPQASSVVLYCCR